MYSSSVLELIKYLLALPVFMKSILTCEIPSLKSLEDSYLLRSECTIWGRDDSMFQKW